MKKKIFQNSFYWDQNNPFYKGERSTEAEIRKGDGERLIYYEDIVYVIKGPEKSCNLLSVN